MALNGAILDVLPLETNIVDKNKMAAFEDSSKKAI